jgi:hypothetical protein
VTGSFEHGVEPLGPTKGRVLPYHLTVLEVLLFCALIDLVMLAVLGEQYKL